LESADVEINGRRPWDLQVHNDAVFSRVLSRGSLGLGESYMDGWWDCECLDEFFQKILRAELDAKVTSGIRLWDYLKALFVNLQTPARSFLVGRRHYDIGNDLYRRMLDRRLIYSCALWSNADALDEAQEAKLDLICRKLNLEPGMRLLDIGCGWGGLARYAAERFQVDVVGVTISKEQAALASRTCKDLPIDIRFQDYRSVRETFDRVVSVGMFEHVGPKNYATFMDVVRRSLKPDGLALLHTIGVQKTYAGCDPWISRYIFPNSKLPSARQICKFLEGRFVMEDWQNLGVHYDKTLLAWFRNFQENWLFLRNRYDERFFRMWKYYLLSCAGAFRARTIQLWQIVLSPNGVLGGWKLSEPRLRESPHLRKATAAWLTSAKQPPQHEE
jgi:cyclopropane-fatty-acyl-phospholipid synthase